MTNLTTPRRTSAAPTPAPRELADMASRYFNQVRRFPNGKYMISHEDAPSPNNRALLLARRDDLECALAPCDRGDAARAIAQMFLAYPQLRLGPDEARATIAVYVSQVQEFPAWAVVAGCQKIIQRPIAFPPSAGELRAAVADETGWVKTEAWKLGHILSAEIEEPRAAVAADEMRARFANLRQEFAAADPAPIIRGNAATQVGRDPVAPSAALLASLEKMQGKAGEGA